MPGGYLIYGYKKEGKRVVIDEAEAAIVRYFFEEYASGVPKKDIAEALNARGERYHGKPWRGRDFDKMLTNAKYTGTFEFGGRLAPTLTRKLSTRHFSTRCNVARNKTNTSRAQTPLG